MNQTTLKKLFAWTGHFRSRMPRRHSPGIWRRRHIAATILLLLLLTLSAAYLYYSTDERVRQKAHRALEIVTGGEIELEYASIDILRQIRIRGLKVFLPNRPHNRENLVFTAQDVTLEHRPLSIMTQRLRLNKIVAYGAQLYITHYYDRSLTNLQLMPLLEGSGDSNNRPIIILHQAALEYRQIAKGVPDSTTRQDIQGRIFPDPHQPYIYRFEFQTPQSGPIRDSSLSGQYNVRTAHLKTSGRFVLDLIDFAHLPRQVDLWKKFYQVCQPTGNILTETFYDPNTGHTLLLTLSDAQLTLPVPYGQLPLHNVNAKFLCTSQKVIIESIEAQYRNIGRFLAKGTVFGYSHNAPFILYAHTENFHLPQNLWTLSSPNPSDNLSSPNPSDSQTVAADHSSPENSDSRLAPSQIPPPIPPPLDAPLSLLPISARNFIGNLKPTGRLDLEMILSRDLNSSSLDPRPDPLTLPDSPALPGNINPQDTPPADINTQTSPAGLIDYQVTLTCHDATIDYDSFPYALSGITGTLIFDPNGATLGPLRAQNGPHETRLNGSLQFGEPHHRYDITIQSENLPLDQKLFTALDPWQKKLWTQFSPSGTINVLYHVSRNHQDDQPQQNLIVDLLDVDAQYRQFPVPLSQMTGRLQGNQNHLSFDIPHIRSGSGQLAVTGSVAQVQTPQPQIDCRIAFQQFPLTHQLAEHLTGPVQTYFRQLHLTGWADGNAYFRTTSQNPLASPAEPANEPNTPQNLLYEISTALHDASLTHDAFPYPLHNVSARGTLTNQNLRIDSFTARNNRSRIDIHGRLDGPDQYQLFIRCDPLELDGQLRQALESLNLRFWDKLNPSGLIELNAELYRKSDQDPNYRVDIVLRHAQLRPSVFDYPFSNLTGTIRLQPDRIAIDQLHSTSETTHIKLDGLLDHADQEHKYDLHVQADNLPLDQTFRDALPVSLASLYDHLDPSGTFQFDLDVSHRKSPSSPGIWNFLGHADLLNAAVLTPLNCSDIQAHLKGSAVYNEQNHLFHLNGELLPSELQLKNRPIHNLAALVNYDGQSQRLNLTQLNSKFCSGRMAGQLQTTLNSSPPGYQVELQFNQLDLPLVLDLNKDSPSPRNLQGRVDGWLGLTRTSPKEKPLGRFLYVVSDAVLGELPLTTQLLSVLNLALPEKGAFNQASLSGDIVGSLFRFDEIHLRGSAVSLTGAGTMQWPSTDLDLVFSVDNPPYLHNLPIISSFLDAIKPAFVQVRATGTFEEPLVESIALPPIDDALRQWANQPSPPKPNTREKK